LGNRENNLFKSNRKLLQRLLILELQELKIEGGKIREDLKKLGKILLTSTLLTTDILLNKYLKTNINKIEDQLIKVENYLFNYKSEYKERFNKFKKIIDEIIKSNLLEEAINLNNRNVWESIDENSYYNDTLKPKNLKPETRKLIIIVDDLDRLLPENAFSIIESLRFYFDVTNVIIIMGINDKLIEDYIKNIYERKNIYRSEVRVYFFYLIGNGLKSLIRYLKKKLKIKN